MPTNLHNISTCCVLRLHWGLINLPNAAAICSWQGCFLWPPPQSPTLLVSIVICQCREWSYNRDRERGRGDSYWGGLRCVWGFPYGVVSLSVCPKMWLLQLDARLSLSLCPLFDGFDPLTSPSCSNYPSLWAFTPQPFQLPINSHWQRTWLLLSNWCCALHNACVAC